MYGLNNIVLLKLFLLMILSLGSEVVKKRMVSVVIIVSEMGGEFGKHGI